MIERYQNQTVQRGIWFAISLAVSAGCGGLAMVLSEKTIELGILVAVTAVASAVAIVVFYFGALMSFGKAKGYSPAFIATLFVGVILAFPVKGAFGLLPAVVVGLLLGPLLPLFVVLFLPDKSNPAKDAEALSYSGVRCVSCNGRMASHLKLCPHCGWTQPACDVLPARPATG